jgi:hypothetical protein
MRPISKWSLVIVIAFAICAVSVILVLVLYEILRKKKPDSKIPSNGPTVPKENLFVSSTLEPEPFLVYKITGTGGIEKDDDDILAIIKEIENKSSAQARLANYFDISLPISEASWKQKGFYVKNDNRGSSPSLAEVMVAGAPVSSNDTTFFYLTPENTFVDMNGHIQEDVDPVGYIIYGPKPFEKYVSEVVPSGFKIEAYNTTSQKWSKFS